MSIKQKQNKTKTKTKTKKQNQNKTKQNKTKWTISFQYFESVGKGQTNIFFFFGLIKQLYKLELLLGKYVTVLRMHQFAVTTGSYFLDFTQLFQTWINPEVYVTHWVKFRLKNEREHYKAENDTKC